MKRTPLALVSTAIAVLAATALGQPPPHADSAQPASFARGGDYDSEYGDHYETAEATKEPALTDVSTPPNEGPAGGQASPVVLDHSLDPASGALPVLRLRARALDAVSPWPVLRSDRRRLVRIGRRHQRRQSNQPARRRRQFTCHIQLPQRRAAVEPSLDLPGAKSGRAGRGLGLRRASGFTLRRRLLLRPGRGTGDQG